MVIIRILGTLLVPIVLVLAFMLIKNKVIGKKAVMFIMIGLLVVMAIPSMFYTVDQTEYGILVTLGKPREEIIEPGPHFKLPYPIQKVEKLSKETFSLTFGYTEGEEGLVLREQETKMITGDENIILADMEIQWRITDPIVYMYNTSKPYDILYNATSASLRNVIGSSTVDDAMTDGRTVITNTVTEKIRELVDSYGLGIQVINVNLQDIDLPTQQVDAAFKAVTDARENKSTLINQGNQYRNQEINSVTGKQNALISQAEGEKVTYIEQAKADVASFNALYEEYYKNSEITKQRLIIETMNQIIKDAKVYIMDSDGSTVKYLPLENIKGGN